MKKYCDQIGRRSKPSVVNFPPLDIKHFSKAISDNQLRKSLGISTEDRVITYMGSFFYFSGLPEVLRWLAKFRPDAEFEKLLLIGGGEQENELRQLVSELGLSDRVIFTGFVSFEDLPKYLALSLVAINTLEVSRVATVAFPNKVLQYLACGLPVVSTRLEGLVSTLDGLPNLIWENSPSGVIETAVRISLSNELERDPVETQVRLDKLFSPESATKSLEESLLLAIEISQGK
jgi:glycosyltransferase involved in cell wall biosynthesis